MRNLKNHMGLLVVFAAMLFLMATPVLAETEDAEDFERTVFGEKQHTVTFYEDSSCSNPIGEPQVVEHGGELTGFIDPPDPPEGEVFLCWTAQNGNGNYGDGQSNIVNSELNLYPTYTKSYTLTFSYQGGKIKEIKVREGTAIGSANLPKEPSGVPTNAVKNGWYQGSRFDVGVVSLGSEITADTEVYRDMNVDYVATYTITFDPGHTDTGRTDKTIYMVEAGAYLNLSAPTGYTRERIDSTTEGVEIGVKYEFQGWRTAKNGGGNEYIQSVSAAGNNDNKTYYASWIDPTDDPNNVKPKYTVTFERTDCDNNSDPIVISDVRENSVILSLPTVTKVGQTFSNQWKIKNVDGSLGDVWVAGTTKVTKDVTLVPVFAQKNYGVTFKGGEGIIKVANAVPHGSLIANLKPETPESYTKSMILSDGKGHTIVWDVVFNATGIWHDDGGNEWDFETDTVQTTLTLTAEYDSHVDKPSGGGGGESGGGGGESGGGGGTDGEGGSGGGTDDNDFDWDSAVVPVDPYDMVSVTFEPKNNDDNKTFSIKKGSIFSESQMARPERAGYTFQHWSANWPSAFDFEQGINSDVTLHAVWRQDVTIVFNSDGGNYVSLKTIPYDTKLEAPTRDPMRTHHTFLGWSKTRQGSSTADSLNEINFDEETFRTDKQVLWAWYESNTKLNFHFGYGEPEKIDNVIVVEGGKRAILDHVTDDPIYPEDTSKVFDGWYQDDMGEPISGDDFMEIGVTTDLYAHWVSGFAVTFKSADDTTLINGIGEIIQRYVSGKEVTPPIVQVNNNKIVEGWYLDKGCTQKAEFTQVANAATDVVIYAKWEPIPTNQKIKITFDGGRGNFAGNENTVIYEISLGNTITQKPTPPVCRGYFFGQWYLDSACKNIVRFDTFKPSKDTTLYARWVCEVKFEPGENKTKPETQLVKIDDSVERPQLPLHDYLNFKGWSEIEKLESDGMLWDFWKDVVKKNMVLYGVWGADVNFNPNGGAFKSDAPIVTVYQYAEDKTINAPIPPRKTGFAFAGWFKNEELTVPFIFSGVEAATDVARNTTLYAKWVEGEDITESPTLYEIKVEVQQGGMFTSDKNFEEKNGNRNYEGSFEAGDVIRFEAKPDSGYYFGSFNFNKGSSTNPSAPIVEFTMPSDDVNLVINFRKSSSGKNKHKNDPTTVTKPETPSVTPTDGSNTNTYFYDTKEHWAKDAIDFVAASNLFYGTEDHKFSPEEEMSRSMFVAVLARMSGETVSGYENKFNDVDAQAWYAKELAWAASKGLVSITQEGTFEPDAAITRQDMAVLLHRYVIYKNQLLPKTEQEAVFIDEKDIAEYAKEAVTSMEKAGIITGQPGNYFDPNRTAERAEVACLFQKYVKLLTTLKIT